MTQTRLMAATVAVALLALCAAVWLGVEMLRGPKQAAMFEVGGPFVLAAARGGTPISRPRLAPVAPSRLRLRRGGGGGGLRRRRLVRSRRMQVLDDDA